MESTRLERAYRKNCGWMFRLAARWLGDDALGADAAHTVWVRIFENPPRNGLGRAYLWTALRNECQHERARGRLLTPLPDSGSTQRLAKRPLTPLELELGERAARWIPLLVELLEMLPARCSEVVRGRVLGYTYQDIADRMGTSIRTSQAQFERAKLLARARAREREREREKYESRSSSTG